MTKSPLGRVGVLLPVREQWEELMKACKKHPYPFEWRGMIKPNEFEYWDDEKENTVIYFGWDGIGNNGKENEMSYSDKQYYKKYGGKFISFKEAMEKLEVKKWIPKIGDELYFIEIDDESRKPCWRCGIRSDEDKASDFNSNCFRTKTEALRKAREINEILKS